MFFLLKICHSISWVADASFSKLVNALTLRDGRRVINLADTLLALSFAKKESGCAGVCHNVTTHWLLWVHYVCHTTTWVRRDLVRDEYSHVELLRDFLQPTHYSVKYLLPFSELTTTRVVNSEWCHDGVDYQERKAVFYHAASCLHQQVYQTVHCESAANHYVVEHGFWVQIEPAGDLLDALRPERILSVDVEDAALASALRSG